jgi:hypothetical protein
MLAGGGRAGAQATAEKPPAAATKGQRVFVCGHSFHVFIARPLAEAARAAGIADHATAGTQFIGGSRTLQHWDLPDDKNQAKRALKAGGVDVLTLSPNWIVPDEGIDRFVDLALEHNPQARIIVQQSWYPFDGFKPELRVAKNEDRDQKTIEQLRPPLADFTKAISEQVRATNQRIGRPVAFVAPVGDAVLALRAKVIAGEAPGIAKQSELFTDPIGHAKPPVQWLAAYCHFGVIYGRSPVGLTTFEKPNDAESKRLNRLLQELAWEAVTRQPLSGVKAE